MSESTAKKSPSSKKDFSWKRYKDFSNNIHWRHILVGIVAGEMISRAVIRTYQKCCETLVLELDLQSVKIVQHEADPGLFSMMKDDDTIPIRHLVDAIRRAAKDNEVGALICRLGNSIDNGKMAQVQEIRQAIQNFNKSGKLSIAYGESLGSFGGSSMSYYLASAFSKIYLAPCGDLTLTGFGVDAPFVKTMLKKLKIDPRIEQRKEYKNAANMFNQEKLTEAHREALESLIISWEQILRRDISPEIMSRRKRRTKEKSGEDALPSINEEPREESSSDMDENEMEELLNGGPYQADEALRRGLIDGMLYRDEIYNEIPGLLDRSKKFVRYKFLMKHTRKRSSILAEHGGTIALVCAAGEIHSGLLLILDNLIEILDAWWANQGQKIAVVISTGEIHSGKSKEPGFGDTSTTSIGSDTVCRTLRKIQKDKSVKAVLLRVDSPGGGHIASDLIAREIIRTKQAGKKVVCSMGNVAASGGYWMALNADHIFAQPGTITGSIGVIFGKFLIRKCMSDHIGITFDDVRTNENTKMYSNLHDYTEEGKETVNKIMDKIYDDFVHNVAKGRNLTTEQVEVVARGRVWTGSDALERGLVDSLGGIRDAIDKCNELCGKPKEGYGTLKVRKYPKHKSLFEVLLEESPENEDQKGASASSSWLPFANIFRIVAVLDRILSPWMRIASHAERIASVSEEPKTVLAPGLDLI